VLKQWILLERSSETCATNGLGWISETFLLDRYWLPKNHALPYSNYKEI